MDVLCRYINDEVDVDVCIYVLVWVCMSVMMWIYIYVCIFYACVGVGMYVSDCVSM